MPPFCLVRFNSTGHYVLLAVAAFVAATGVYGQLGPGGVSHETPNTLAPTQSDVRIWLDASSLTSLADGDPVTEWNDISFSAINDKGFRQASDNFLPPIFRDDPSASINGYPVVTFADGSMLKVNSSNDLNTSILTTYEQTIIMSFRTSADVNSRQVLWEEGGTVRGLNIFINNGEIYLGVYDIVNDNDPGSPNVPKFGYNYVKTPIQPNTTYVLSHVFSAPTDNSLTGFVRGYQNGSFFGTLINGGQEAGGVGGIYRHPDAVGIGAVNSDSFNENGSINNQTGQFSFKGRLAELCYYNRLLNDAERIIVENYLGAKYYANIIVNDRYTHQASYGTDVVGIGQTTNSPANRHDVSQGRNPFEISVVNAAVSYNAPNEFLLMGTNGAALTLTDQNVPNDVGSTMRTERIWRMDESGELSNIKFRFRTADLPPLPTGFTKHVLIFDNTSANFPNFSTTNASVVEIRDVGSGYWEATANVVDNSFMTIGVLKPQVAFKTSEAFAIEGDPSPDSTGYFTKVYARLNYRPTSLVRIDFSFSDGTATRASDYGYLNSDVANGIAFPPGFQEVPVRLWVKNDVILEDSPSTESFTINLAIGSNTTAGLGLGAISQHTFTIYDNDPPPKLSFAQASSITLEDVGTETIQIVRTGSTVGAASARIRIVATGTTAAANDDYTYPIYKTVNFIPGESQKDVAVDIIDDLIDEDAEYLRFQIYNITGAGTDASSNLFHTVEIVDNDVEPTIEFTSATSQNFETTGTPLIYFELDRPSSKEISFTYTKSDALATAATFGPDYGLAFPATIVIPAGDTLGFPSSFVVQQDGVDEDDETVEFILTSATNALLGSQTNHVYTIKDYSTFEWKGVAGVGKESDNILWLDIPRQSGGHNSALQTVTNFSPQNINITQNTAAHRAQLQTTSNLINDLRTLRFDGADDFYTIDNSGLINLAPFVVNKSYFMTIRTGTSINGFHTIYKQGGGSRGLTIYIFNGDLYFTAWNNPNDGIESQWGSGSSNPVRYARFDNISPNTNYVISCLFDKDATQKLRVYVNGQLGARAETGSCGRIYSHSGAVSLGGADGSTRYHDDSNTSGRYYNGYIAELIHFTDAPLNETRRIILENYLSGKYNIPLASNQIVDLNTDYFHEIAGIGQLNVAANEVHTDAQGSAILRIKSPASVANGSFMLWGHNNVPLDQTWPWSGAGLPAGVVERSGRVWKMRKTGIINNVDLFIRYSQAMNASSFGISDLKLLIHTNSDGQNFSNATVINASELMSGFVVRFGNVNLPNGAFFALANSSTITPLPIELLSFTAEPRASSVMLNWVTSSEINNALYEVERAGGDLDFQPIGYLNGAGNSNTTLAYHLEDNDPLSGISYYRLKQTDFDGTYEYSDVISVIFEYTGRPDSEFVVFPNPVKNKRFTLHNLSTPEPTRDLAIGITDLSGQLIYKDQFDGTLKEKLISLPQDLSTGFYILNLSSDNFHQAIKLVVE